MTRKATPAIMDLDATRQRLDRLGLLHAGEQVDTLVSEGVKHNTAQHQLVDQREKRRLQTSPSRHPVLTLNRTICAIWLGSSARS